VIGKLMDAASHRSKFSSPTATCGQRHLLDPPQGRGEEQGDALLEIYPQTAPAIRQRSTLTQLFQGMFFDAQQVRLLACRPA